ncbi:MAG: hypothetical protein REI64_10760 [Pedobacter sp.]|uniref:hypothetical protein n=1 Tax=Pedobacter sp. TaxID=1411316 RepID=UPI00280796A6|nr:hypothetical protein [Pedobacter sp.]MDQ8005271.1 hypothetical protein [Pedobacter sp.]
MTDTFLISKDKFYLVAESNSEQTYYYSGFFEKGKPVFMLAIAEAVHIYSYQNAKQLFQELNKLLPCQIWKVENNGVERVL